MLQAIKSNPKTSIFGVLAIVSEVLRQAPDLVSFLPDNIRGYVLGFSSIIFAVFTVISARDKETPAQTEVKQLKKEIEREELKQEITSETAVLVKEAKATVDAKIEPIMQVLPVIAPTLVSSATAAPSQPLVVESIQTESITTNKIHNEPSPTAEVGKKESVVEIPKV